MRRIVSTMLIVLILGGIVGVIYAQEETPEVTPTLEATDEATPETTPETTQETTPELTATTEGAPATPAPTMTPEATDEATPEATDLPVPMDEQAHYRIAHFAADAPAVTALANGEALDMETIAFPELSEWQTVETGSYEFSLEVEDTGESSAALAPVETTLDAGTWTTIAVLGVGEDGTLRTHFITEDYSDLNPGTGGLTVFNGIDGELMVNLNRDEVPFVTELTPPGTESGVSDFTSPVDAGTYDFQIVETQNPSNVLSDLSQTEIEENAYTFIAVVGAVDDPQTVVEVTDRAEVAIELGMLEEPGTIIEAASADENLTTLVDAIEMAGLTEMLSNSDEYTVFAPANFVLDTVDMSDPDALAEILRNHIVEGEVTSNGVINAETLETLGGEELTVEIRGNDIFVNNAQVITLNIPATNGVIHMINDVLMPETAQ